MSKKNDIEKLNIYQKVLKETTDSIIKIDEIKKMLEKGYSLRYVLKLKKEEYDAEIIAELTGCNIDETFKNKKEKLENAINIINGIINKIEDEELKQIIYYRILRGKTWREISDIMYLDFTACNKKFLNYIKG